MRNAVLSRLSHTHEYILLRFHARALRCEEQGLNSTFISTSLHALDVLCSATVHLKEDLCTLLPCTRAPLRRKIKGSIQLLSQPHSTH